MKHYVYRLDDPITKEFYIGSRSCTCKIEDDTYTGSYKTWKPQDKSRLVKTILKFNFRKRETCIKYEANIIKENINDVLNRNYHIPNEGFHTNGMTGKLHWLYGKVRRPEVRLKISKSHIGKKMSESSKLKNRLARLGKVYSEKTRLSMSMAAKGKILTESHRKNISRAKYRKILQYDMDDNFIKEWDALCIVSEKLGIDKTGIQHCCAGKTKSSGSFKWKYK